MPIADRRFTAALPLRAPEQATASACYIRDVLWRKSATAKWTYRSAALALGVVALGSWPLSCHRSPSAAGESCESDGDCASDPHAQGGKLSCESLPTNPLPPGPVDCGTTIFRQCSVPCANADDCAFFGGTCARNCAGASVCVRFEGTLTFAPGQLGCAASYQCQKGLSCLLIRTRDSASVDCRSSVWDAQGACTIPCAADADCASIPGTYCLVCPAGGACVRNN